jgi:hypothetical protein
MTDNEKKYEQTIDFYWKSIAFYCAVLIIYALLAGTVAEGTFSLKLADPVVILLVIIILSSSISMFYRFYGKRAVIISDNGIKFSNRFREKFYNLNQIEYIDFTREKLFRSKRRYSIVKIKVIGKKFPIRIRPSSFEDENELVDSLKNIRAKIGKNK